MKDFFKIEESEDGKFYLNENYKYYRLAGPAIEWSDGNKSYYINDICYMEFYENYNILYFDPNILLLIPKYEKYIKQNIKDLILEYNPKIELAYYFTKEQINKLPSWLKDIFII